MTKLYWRWPTALACGAMLGGLGCSAPAARGDGRSDEDIAIDTGVQYQRLEGFGASVAWYQDWLTGHERKAELYDHLFAGLGLDILRFRNRYQRTNESSELGAETELVEQATDSLGHRPKVLLTSWSPPAALKVNADDDCTAADSPEACTLVRVDGAFAYDQFAGYWADSLTYYADAGIVVDFASLQNEPDFKPSGWEGCRFEPTETDTLPGYDQALEAVAARVAELPQPPALIGPETLGIHRQAVEKYVARLDRSLLGGVAHHLYERGGDTWDWEDPGPDSYITPMRGVASVAGDLAVFQTEFGTDEDDFVRGGFETAWMIQNQLLEANGSAFLYWDLIWPGHGLIALEADSPEYTIRDQYHAVRHFARYTDPGWSRVAATSLEPFVLVSAFIAPDEDQLTVVLMNIGDSREHVTIDLGTFADAPIRAFRTVFVPGETEAWTELDEPDPGEGVSLPSRSVVTVITD